MAPIPTLALVEQEIRRRNDTDRAMSYGREGQRNPWLWMLLLPIVKLGLASFWTYYWLTVDWRRHSIRQQRVTDELSAIFRNLGYPAANLIDEGATPDRNYWMHLVLTIVTFGAWYIYWFYLMFKDGNHHMAGDHFLEDQLVNTLRVSGAGTAAP
jgi:hypothetical protein